MSQAARSPWWARAFKSVAATRFGGWYLTHIGHAIDRPLMRLSGGRLSHGALAGLPLLTITTIGAKSGQPRTMPLMAMPHGDALVVIASNGGSTRHPAWYANIRANPRVTVDWNGRSAAYTASEAAGARRDALWQEACRQYPGFAVYQRRAGTRQIPVIILTPDP